MILTLCRLIMPQVGMGAGVSARYVRSLTEKSTGRISGRFGATGVELEVGASRRLSHSATAGLYVSVGLAVRRFLMLAAMIHCSQSSLRVWQCMFVKQSAA